MKIVFTGGHHNSALVVALLLIKKGHQVFWFGHKHTMQREKSLSAEYLEISKNNIPFFEIKTGKFYKTYNISQFFKIIFGFFQSLYLLLRIKPDFIVSFGSYVAFPVVLAGTLLKTPFLVHEQTTQAGLTNRLVAVFAKKIFITWQNSSRFFPKNKTELIGLPIKKDFFSSQKMSLFKNSLPTIFIIGGKQGSQLINCLVEEVLPQLLSKYNLIHQTGRIEKTGDFERLLKKKNLLSPDLQERYLVKPYFFGEEMANLLSSADFVISRSGAHIIYELCALGKPAILIPISWSYKDEQLINALMLKKLGIAEVLMEKGLTGLTLLKIIDNFFCNIKKQYKNGSKAKKIVFKDAAERMVSFIEKKS